MAAAMGSSVLSIVFEKCCHKDKQSVISSFANNTTFIDIFCRYHDTKHKNKECTVLGKSSIESCHGHDISPTLTIGEVVQLFNVRCFVFTCIAQNQPTLDEMLIEAAGTASKAAVNAFEIIMSGGRAMPSKKSTSSGVKAGISRKDELYNKLIEHFFKPKKMDFPRQMLDTEGAYMVQVLTNALWYITNQHTTISDAARDRHSVLPIPDDFSIYQGYNEVKRKKVKQMPLDVGGLKSHSEALYSILLKPVTTFNESWRNGAAAIKGLADCLNSYMNYLETKNLEMKQKHSMDHPARTISSDATIEHRQPVARPKDQYAKLDSVLKDAHEEVPIFFDEQEHTIQRFCDTAQKFRFLRDLHLSVPTDMIKFSPGGSSTTIVIFCKTSENQTEAEMLIQGARLMQKSRHRMVEFHTRAMKKHFQEKVNNVTSLNPSILEFIYKELTNDGSRATNPVMHERLRLISLGNVELLADLRSCNPGRPNTRFDVFFEKLGELIEDITAADDRRHGQAHLSEFISVRDMIEKTTKKCPPDTPIPSASLVRLQFAPKNPYCKGALNFTSRLDVQFKIQRRQLRIAHVDSHYCNAQFKYLKAFAVEEKDRCLLICCDDKAKVPIGEPGSAVSTGVRGKKSIVPTSSTLVALDHDMTKSSLTPSVVLQCNIPSSVDKSFVQGKVVTVLNDSVFQSASPFRHITVISKMMINGAIQKPFLLKFTDGGTDQRNTLESVKLANICLFKELNLDFLAHVRCAPGQSFTNPAERVMSLLNLGLQNVSLGRNSCGYDIEDILKSKNSMAEIRSAHEMKPDKKIKEKWSESLEEAKRTITTRFIRLKWKDEPVQIMDPVTDEEIDISKRHMRELFPEMNVGKLQKSHTKKIRSYQTWLENHSKSTHYVFQLRKCDDRNCCLAPSGPLPSWLPDPVLDGTGEHYLPYSEVRGSETTEKDRPSLNSKKTAVPEKKRSEQVDDSVQDDDAPESRDESMSNENEYIEIPESPANLCTVQNARSITECIECRKPRVVYSYRKLTERLQYSLAVGISEWEYSCGSPLLPPSNPLYTSVMCRSSLTCETPVEIAYYRSGLGVPNICCYCCGESDDTNARELCKKFKTVLPICNDCINSGKNVITQRPYGKEARK